MPAASSAATSQAACAGRALLPALRALAARAPSPILGLVYGAGFEDRPELLTLIAKRWPLLGNTAATVARLKAPESFFAELDRLGIAHPATTSERPAEGCRLARQAQGRRRRQPYRAEPAATRRGARSTTRSASLDARSRRCSSPMDGARACLASASNGRRRPRAARFVMAARCGPPLSGQAWRGRWPQPSRRSPGPSRSWALPRPTFWWMATTRCCSRSIRVPAPRSTFSTAAPNPLMRLHLEAIREGRLPRSGLKFDDAMASAIVYSPARLCVPSGTASGPTGPPTDLSRRNGSTKTVRYALCWRAVAHEHRRSAWLRSEFAEY